MWGVGVGLRFLSSWLLQFLMFLGEKSINEPVCPRDVVTSEKMEVGATKWRPIPEPITQRNSIMLCFGKAGPVSPRTGRIQ